MTARLAPLLLAIVLSLVVAKPVRAEDDATVRARAAYDMGVRLFEKERDYERALIEFRKANEIKSRPAALFMMAQCEYLLGQLKEAKAHYEQYKADSPDGEFVGVATDRIDSIDKRPSTFVINTVPEDVSVHITPDGRPGPPVDGQAPNNFQVPRGRYRIDVTKPKYQGQTRIVEVDLAETKPLFFKLDPIPARLEIETAPGTATLYVNGNRARNPYRQDVLPGNYEIFAEAPDYTARTVELTLAPGERRLLTGPNRLALPYVQRSGRPELLVASGVLGAFVGAGAVAAAIGKDLDNPGVAAVLLTTTGGVTGIIGGVLLSTSFVPKYIPDNRALFILGSMWIGAAEGALTGIVWRQTVASNAETISPCPGSPCRTSLGELLRAGFVGSVPGLAVGLTTGGLLAKRAPTYGRAALIQSAAVGGALTGAVVQLATQWKPYGPGWDYTYRELPSDVKAMPKGTEVYCSGQDTDGRGGACAKRENSFLDLMPGALIGLNVGLVAGLMGAYLPDQTKYGPSWKRVLLIDLATGAGFLAGGVGGCVARVNDCLISEQPTNDARATAAITALAGGAIGAAAGVLLTRHFDDDMGKPQTAPPVTVTTALLPIRAADGSTTPGLGAVGTF